MKNQFFLLLSAIILLNNSCSNGQTQSGDTKLQAAEFSKMISQASFPQVVDVRTPEEYEKGHLQNAKNIDWNGNDFQAGISKLDKAKPVFVYCLSGGRSSSAAAKMREDGFTKVYELNGGIMKWRAADLPETTNSRVTSEGMSKLQFDKILATDKLVLIDFYADWCPPCKKMKPYLEEISNELKDKVVVVRINADDNQAICKELQIDALPVLQLYKNNSLQWSNTGYITKEEVLKHIQ